ncbi:MAG TPA: hypothetical protein VGL51_04710 [Solirubrobacteraceae bacterium]|jgi:hypothetical protein
MRSRITVLAAGIATLAFAAVPGIAGAAPQHNRGLTIHAVPHSIQAGDPVLIYGQLKGPGHADQPITLYHRINPRPFFTVIQRTRTDSAGRYEFIRLRDIVQTNRSWFVRGPGSTHSRTVHERVQALISLAASSPTGLTRHPIVFSGHVTPNHAGERVLLQVQKGSSDDWTTVDRGRIGPGSNYSISHAWRTPGGRDVRVRFRGDRRNTAAVSDPVAITVQQTQVPGFTITTNDPIVSNGTQATISGVLDMPGTTTPQPGVTVQLFAHVPRVSPFKVVQSTVTGADGSYSITVQSTTNELYQARTASAPVRHSAVLFEGVQDVVNMSASSSTSTVGGQVTFSGDVSPGKAGHVIYLQKLGRDSDWHTVKVGFVNANSTFQFGWTFGAQGSKEFRARITGGPVNVGGASTPVTIAVSQPALTSLPTS